jgi:hypothetical protein
MESSLSLLSEPHLKRLRHNGYAAFCPPDETGQQVMAPEHKGSVIFADRRQSSGHDQP